MKELWFVGNQTLSDLQSFEILHTGCIKISTLIGERLQRSTLVTID